MNERDELAAILNKAYWDRWGGIELTPPSKGDAAAADAILAAGYRKPRTITTAEELDALGEGSVIIDSSGDVSQKRAGMWCGYETAPLPSSRIRKYLPGNVLYEPQS